MKFFRAFVVGAVANMVSLARLGRSTQEPPYVV